MKKSLRGIIVKIAHSCKVLFVDITIAKLIKHPNGSNHTPPPSLSHPAGNKVTSFDTLHVDGLVYLSLKC